MPAMVPVPWASTNNVSRGSRPALAYIDFAKDSCASAFGKKIPEVLPSWPTPESTMTA
jgi:hypothetical protein